MLSKKTQYALHALSYLAKKKGEGPVLISEISEQKNISRKFLENILLELKKSGILGSKKGKGGGYYLLQDPKQVPLSKVIRMFNGPLAMLPCVSHNYYEQCETCNNEGNCRLNGVMAEVRDETLRILENKTLIDIA
jgi:Rrf2 family protein